MKQLDEPNFAALSKQFSQRGPAELTFSPTTKVEISGRALLLSWSQGELLVSGGASLVSGDLEPVPAGTWRRRAEQQALERIEALAETDDTSTQSIAVAVGNSVAKVRELELAASALIDEKRWSDVVRITNGLAADRAAVADLIAVRGVAFQRLGQPSAARSVLVELAQSVLTGGRNEPEILMLFADVLGQQGEYATALKLAERANSLIVNPSYYSRVLMFRTEAALAESSEVLTTANFFIRHPVGGTHTANEIGKILELERSRLSKWIKPVAGPRIEVHLLPAADFSEAYGGNVEVIGIYDGRIRLPFGEVEKLNEYLISVISHELAHALIARASDDKAPAWLQEGLAQLAEKTDLRINPMRDYDRVGQLISFFLLDEVFDSFPNAKLVAAAYDEALWTCLFFEKRRGRGVFNRMFKAYSEGSSTDEVLRQIVGLEGAKLDTALRKWWLEDSHASLK